MIVNRVIIKNAKSISYLDANLRNRRGESISVPYDVISAPNGQGKTTFLECISLIGHAPCMTIAESSIDGWSTSPTILLQGLGRTEEIDIAFDCPKDDQDLDKWFESENFDGMTAVYIELQDGHYDGNIYTFIMVIEKSDEYGITNLLSQKYGDDDFASYAAIIFKRSDSPHILDMISRVDKGRCYFDIRKQLIRGRSGGPDAITVSFINTDMNDFGRANDLRESPKILNEDFETEIIKRIGFPSPEEDAAGCSDIIYKINASVRRVMDTRRWQFSNPNAVTSYVSIRSIARNKKNILRIHLKKEKHFPWGLKVSDYPGDSLSAGENEIFFVLMILYILGGKNSIILLDEPDLHVAGYMRKRLFDEIIRIVDFSNQHLIVSSHSSAAMKSVKGLRLLPRSDALPGLGHGFMRRLDPFRKSSPKDHARVLLETRAGPEEDSRFLIGYDSRYYWNVLSGSIDGFGNKLARFTIAGQWMAGFIADYVNQLKDWWGAGAVMKFIMFIFAISIPICLLLFSAAFSLTFTPAGFNDQIHIMNREEALKYGTIAGAVASAPFLLALGAVIFNRAKLRWFANR